ncbi:MAG TPA: outer membrane beta-barrel protein [Pyrinomonadaceae bacterium]|nr:outer membrane beta-barrel protein [Pyrinomonadaceae bacterium]
MSSFARTLSLVTLAIVLVCATSQAQDREVPKFEAGVQFTLLNVNQPTPVVNCCVIVPSEYSNSYWKSGIGGRLTYNFNEFLAAEATVNYFPDSRTDPVFFRAQPEGKIYQGQFGVKAGKRSDWIGIFAKARPGFVGFTEVNQLVNSTPPVTFTSFRTERETYFSMDVGGVVEFYPSRNTVIRIDAGDTIIRYGTFRTFGFIFSQPVLERAPETRHNFQLVTGFGFRF